MTLKGLNFLLSTYWDTNVSTYPYDDISVYNTFNELQLKLEQKYSGTKWEQMAQMHSEWKHIAFWILSVVWEVNCTVDL